MAVIDVKVQAWHVPRVTERIRGTMPEFSAECICGWTLNVRYGDRGSAEIQADNHLNDDDVSGIRSDRPLWDGRFDYRIMGSTICGHCLGKGIVTRRVAPGSDETVVVECPLCSAAA